MPRSLWPAETTVIGWLGFGKSRQSFIVKYLPLKSLRPVSHSSRITATYSVE